MSAQDLADYLGTTIDVIYGWRKARIGSAAARLGKQVRYRKSDVDAWVASHTRRNGGPAS